jgi:hypothetical protein
MTHSCAASQGDMGEHCGFDPSIAEKHPSWERGSGLPPLHSGSEYQAHPDAATQASCVAFCSHGSTPASGAASIATSIAPASEGAEAASFPQAVTTVTITAFS